MHAVEARMNAVPGLDGAEAAQGGGGVDVRFPQCRSESGTDSGQGLEVIHDASMG